MPLAKPMLFDLGTQSLNKLPLLLVLNQLSKQLSLTKNIYCYQAVQLILPKLLAKILIVRYPEIIP
jgi:hypothetical protein